MILKIFFLGSIITFPVLVFSLFLSFFLSNFNIDPFISKLIMVVFVASITEELAKYLIVKKSILKNPECDEPIDVMIYAITVALGFAAFENLLFLFPLEFPFCYKEIATGSFFRFLTGTFLHALTSGLMGYFLAVSILKNKKKKLFISTGIFLAILLHALYNLSIIMSELKSYTLIVAPTILIILFIIVFICFRKLRKLPSVCRPE
jgi:protease PrsW